MITVRLAAAQVLLAVERGRATLGAEVDRARAALTDDRDRGLLVELTTGTLRWQSELDALLGQCSRRPVAELDPAVRATIRLGAYQLEHLDRIPVHAIVHESVELVRSLDRAQAAGFVNAVLRTLTRDRAKLRLPRRPVPGSPAAAQIEYLATTLSHPAWLVKRWLERAGFDAAETWCRFNNSAPNVTARSTGKRPTDNLRAALSLAGVESEPARFVRDAFYLAPGAASRIPPDLGHDLLIQDEASQLVAHVVGARPGERVLDLCAAPGGKTVVIAADLTARADAPGSSVLVAGDRRRARVALLQTTLRSAGARAAVVALDATRSLPFGPVFDRVLLDAPCSGLGVVRRDPDLKWSRTEEQLAGLAANQRAMLVRAAEVVRPGGSITYATCSSEPDENDAVVAGFLESDSRFALARAEPGERVAGSGLIDADGFLRTTPFEHGLDAFFAAVLVRRQSA